MRAGDNFEAATALPGATATSTEASQIATVEAGEPKFGINATSHRSLWWKWTAPVNGRAVVDLAGSTENFGGSSYGKYLVFYIAKGSGPAANSLALVGSAGGQTAHAPAAEFPAVGGATYYIQVASYSADE